MVQSTRPFCINEAYMNCEAPPNLSELDAFRLRLLLATLIQCLYHFNGFVILF